MKQLLFSTLIISILTSCKSGYLSKSVRNELRNNLLNKEINVGRDGNTFILTIHYNFCKINFSFKESEIINKTALDCSLNSISKNTIDSLSIKAKEAIVLARKNNVNASTCKFVYTGIALKLYMKDNSVYLYCPDKSILKGNYIEYINSATFIDSGWYYKKEDK